MKTSIQTAPHHVWQDVCDAWSLADTDMLSVKQEAMPAGTSEVPHFHKTARQFFFVLEGELTMLLNNAPHLVAISEGIEIPPGEVHQARNDSTAPVKFLVVSAPSTTDDRHTL